MIAPLLAQTTPTVIWVPVKKPTFDLVGVVLAWMLVLMFSPFSTNPFIYFQF